MKQKVVVGLSGGVDSSVAAWLLKEQGYEVIGLFMKNWEDASVTLTASCTWEDDWLFAQMVARQIGIPVHLVDLSKDYYERVVEYLFSEYENGRTPNPDVLCNREIKFDLFVKEAKELGADLVATGHYCRKRVVKKNNRTVYQLVAGVDNNKDQSYFLCQLNQEQLSEALFPIGELTKEQVRNLAEKIKMPTATRKDSQGICFVGKVDLPTFLQQKLEAKTGDIIIIAPGDYQGYGQDVFQRKHGQVVGKHRGAHFYTIGQRKGLNVGGTQQPLYVLGTDVNENIVYVGEGTDHPGLYRKELNMDEADFHWIHDNLVKQAGGKLECSARIRYRQKLFKATLVKEDERYRLLFDAPQRAVAPGQFAAIYMGGELVGSGVISA